MAPLYRLADSGHASALVALKGRPLTRQEVLDANQWLDAQDEAQEDLRELAKKKT